MSSIRPGASHVALAGLIATLMSCQPRSDAPEPQAPESEAPGIHAERPSSDLIDPTRIAVGDSILGLRVVAIDLQPSVADSGMWVGEVQFAGRIRLDGEYGGHPDYPDPPTICFYADSASAARLPRLPYDTRYGWLCFTNPESARVWLGDPARRRPAHVTVEEFRYSFAHTDVYNTAMLVRAPR